MLSRSTSATTSFTTRARTIASREANGSSISRSRGFIASTCASATRLRWPPLRRRRKAVAEAREIEPLEPGVRLGERRPALHAVEGQAEGDIVARRLPRQHGIVLEKDPHLRARKVGLDGPRQRLLQPDHGAQQARFARARRPDQAHEAALAHGKARSLEDRLSAIGNRQIADAQDSTPDDRSVVQPGHARTRLDEAGGDQALLDALGRVEVDGHRFGVERVAVARDDLTELLEVEPGGHLLGESRAQLIAGHRAQRLERTAASATISGRRRSISLVRTATPMNSNDPPRWCLASSRSMAFTNTRAPARRNSVSAGSCTTPTSICPWRNASSKLTPIVANLTFWASPPVCLSR